MIKQFHQIKSLKDNRLKQLYSLINKDGPIPKSDLIAKTGLTTTTCSRLIEDLLDQKLIIENGLGESSGGRKPCLYEIEPEAFNLIGIDISRTYTKVLLMNLNYKIKEEARMKMDHTSTPEDTINFIVEKINNMLIDNRMEIKDLLGIGIGTIGPLDRKNGIILNPFNFPSDGWLDVPIKEILSERLKTKVIIDYGVNTALLAEYQNSYYRTYNNIVYIIKGVGSRTGIIMDGNLKHGTDKFGVHGQGHMIVDIHGRKCTCGEYGCVQAYSSINVMITDVIKSLKLGKKSILNDRVSDIENIQFEDICQAVNENDPLCCEIIENAAYYTGMGISNLINVLHPELIILSGPIYNNMNLFYEIVTKIALKRSKVIYPNHNLQFSRGELGENAIAIGAGGLVLNYFLE